MGFIFGGNTGETPESVARKRELANALAQGTLRGNPQGWGGGLGAIADALMYRKLSGQADVGESAGRSMAAEQFAPLIEALNMGGGQPQPSNVGEAIQAPQQQPQMAPQPQMAQPQPQAQPASFKDQSRIASVAPQHNTLLPPEALQAGGMTQAPPAPQQQVAQAPAQPQGGIGNISMQQAYGVMSGEWATPAQRKVAGEVFKMKFQQLDPKYQQELLKLERENNPDLMRRLKVLDAQALGQVDEGFAQNKEQRGEEIAKREEKRKADELARQNGFTGTDTMSPADQMAAAGGTVQSQKFRNEVIEGNQAQASARTRKAQQAGTALDSLIRFEGKAMAEGIAGNPLVKSLIKHVPGTNAFDASQLANTIESAIVLGGMEDMRASSSTGATGFGAMQKAELDLLTRRLGSLAVEQSQDQLQSNVDAVFQHFTKSIHGPPPPGLSWEVVKAATKRGIPADQLYLKYAEQNGIRLVEGQGWVK